MLVVAVLIIPVAQGAMMTFARGSLGVLSLKASGPVLRS